MVDELGVGKFIKLPKRPPAAFKLSFFFLFNTFNFAIIYVFKTFNFAIISASPYQSNRNVKDASNCDEKKLNKEQEALPDYASILPISPSMINDLVDNILAFGARHELKKEQY